MTFTQAEIEYLSVWAREEWEPDCYQRPAHKLQLAHGIVGAYVIDLIKAWACTEGRMDQEILEAADNQNPSWPWVSSEEFRTLLEEAKNAKNLIEKMRPVL